MQEKELERQDLGEQLLSAAAHGDVRKVQEMRKRSDWKQFSVYVNYEGFTPLMKVSQCRNQND